MPQHVVTPETDVLNVYRGIITLYQCSRSVKIKGTVTLQWFPSPQLRFDGKSLAKQPRLDLGAAELRTNAHGIRGPVLITGQHILSGGRISYSGIFSSFGLLGQRRNVTKVRIQLVNFPCYIGRPVRFGSNDKPLLSSSRLCLQAHGWRVALDQDPKCSDLFKEIKEHGGYATTHTGLIRRTSNRKISFDQAEEFINYLHFFFGFLAGQWTGPILSAGLGKTSPTWKTMGSWKVTTNREPRSWFPSFYPDDTEKLLSSFRHLWLNPLWNRALRMIIHWYIQANKGSHSTESAIVASFIPLELLAWLVVVERGRKMSATKFSKLDTSERLEKLLYYSGIPLRIPKNFSVIRKSPLVKRKTNGPRSLTEIRNALVHPKKQKLALLSRMNPIELFELKELALSYVELSLLSALGYSGKYSRRVYKGWKGDDIQTVPWG
jgi:hypothetical protein